MDYTSYIDGEIVRPLRAKVLFLDFDGVLHPRQRGSLCFADMFFTRIKPKEIDIVISSNWKNQYSFQQLLGFFEPQWRELFVGTTPRFDAIREKEILAFVEMHSVTKWLAVDDAKHEFPTMSQNLVATEYAVGITTTHVGKIIDFFEE